MKKICVILIWVYKKYISPKKGFSCAHRVFHGGDSCSTYILEYIKEYGVISTLYILKSRFTECAIAAKKLNEKDDDSKRNRKKKNDSSCSETFAIDGAMNAACCLLSSFFD